MSSTAATADTTIIPIPVSPAIDLRTGFPTREWYSYWRQPHFTNFVFDNIITVEEGGTGVTEGASGGVLTFVGTTNMQSSETLGRARIVFGGGLGAVPSTSLGLGESGQVLTANPVGFPTWEDSLISAKVLGFDSVLTSGSLSNGVVLVGLVNDALSPGNTYFYGTTTSGAKGFVQLGAVLHGSTSVDVAIGADGSATFTATGDFFFDSTALANTSSNTVVMAASGGVENPDLAVGANVAAVVGVAYTSATTGNPITVMRQGILTEVAWSWTSGEPVYCAVSGGALTQTAPATGAVVTIGVALTPTTILVGLGPAYLRS